MPAADVQRYYNDNIQQYQTPEQIRASHILLKTDGKDEATVRKQAEAILAQLKGGADFAALARRCRRTRLEGQRRRPRLLQPRPHGARVRDGGVRDAAGSD